MAGVVTHMIGVAAASAGGGSPPPPGTARQYMVPTPNGPIYINADAEGRAYMAAPGVLINEDP